jgi:RimJ/RimL family protein N-acetyltransferase
VVGSLGALQVDEGTREESRDILSIGLHITSAYRGRKIGSKMIEYADTWAREHGYKRITASIFTTNQRSLALFTHAGFVQESIKEKKIRIGSSYIDEALMAKALT